MTNLPKAVIMSQLIIGKSTLNDVLRSEEKKWKKLMSLK